MYFRDRIEAGRRLAARLESLRGQNLVVLGLPRGGVPVAGEIARALKAPLDVILVRKLGVPFEPELAMGAIGEGDVRIMNDAVVNDAHVRPDAIEEIERHERAELQRRALRFRRGRPQVSLAGRVALVVDDGVATGSTARAACRVARAHGATRVVFAAPVAPPSAAGRLARDADQVILLDTPDEFFAIGQFYDDFTQVTDDEVEAILSRAAPVARTNQPAAAADPPAAGGAAVAAFDHEVEVPVAGVALRGHLTIPRDARGVVVFAHGSGSSRHSPRNRHVASVLQRAGLGTLLFDLLTPDEEQDRANVFDVDLLARRLLGVTRWLRAVPEAGGLPIGYFGASTGAGAALIAAAEPDSGAVAVVSRGGRPDLAGGRLAAVRAPTLLVVGGDDTVVIELNRDAQQRLTCESELAIVPGATHLFEEPGTLQRAAELARDWFVGHLAPSTPAHVGARGRHAP
ncbi:MAG TPA: phosphoribosyltransferase family protein [Candidatus Eisenbacteria bacterium]|nr:phosphoribosyltransferase family protein [Candidatus Eisenbacteria bacterium]